MDTKNPNSSFHQWPCAVGVALIPVSWVRRQSQHSGARAHGDRAGMGLHPGKPASFPASRDAWVGMGPTRRPPGFLFCFRSASEETPSRGRQDPDSIRGIAEGTLSLLCAPRDGRHQLHAVWSDPPRNPYVQRPPESQRSLLFWTFPKNGIVQPVVSCAWRLSPRMIFLRFGRIVSATSSWDAGERRECQGSSGCPQPHRGNSLADKYSNLPAPGRPACPPPGLCRRVWQPRIPTGGEKLVTQLLGFSPLCHKERACPHLMGPPKG